MEEELELLASSSQKKRETLQERFERMCPYYLSVGMPLNEYWDGEGNLVKYYRQAHEQNVKRKNEELWLQGLYIYNALTICLSNSFRKKGESPKNYTERPIAITKLEMQEEKERLEKEKMVRIYRSVQGNLKQYKGSKG